MQVVTWIVAGFLIVINGYLLLDFFSAEVHGVLFNSLLSLILALYVMFIVYLVLWGSTLNAWVTIAIRKSFRSGNWQHGYYNLQGSHWIHASGKLQDCVELWHQFGVFLLCILFPFCNLIMVHPIAFHTTTLAMKKLMLLRGMDVYCSSSHSCCFVGFLLFSRGVIRQYWLHHYHINSYIKQEKLSDVHNGKHMKNIVYKFVWWNIPWWYSSNFSTVHIMLCMLPGVWFLYSFYLTWWMLCSISNLKRHHCGKNKTYFGMLLSLFSWTFWTESDFLQHLSRVVTCVILNLRSKKFAVAWNRQEECLSSLSGGELRFLYDGSKW